MVVIHDGPGVVSTAVPPAGRSNFFDRFQQNYSSQGADPNDYAERQGDYLTAKAGSVVPDLAVSAKGDLVRIRWRPVKVARKVER